MKMRAGLLGGLLLCAAVRAEEPETFTLGPVKQVETVRVKAWKYGAEHPKGLFLVTPGYGTDVPPWALKELEPWEKHARAGGFAVAAADFKWTPAKDPKKAFDGGMEIVRQIADKVCGPDAPVFIYSRNSDAANRFALDCADRNMPQLKGWMCFANQTWKPVPRRNDRDRTAGIIAAATDSIWFDYARGYFMQGRNAGKNWTWLGYRPVDAAQAKEFAGQYFGALLASGTAQWREIGTKKEFPSSFDETSEGLSWFPDRAVGEAWVKIQQERSGRPTVVEKAVDMSREKLPDLQMYLRLPPGHKDASGVRGVIAYCTWVRERNSLVQQLTFDTNQPAEKLRSPAIQMLRFATKHNLAVVTWSTPGKWHAGENSDDLEEGLVKMDEQLFDAYAKGWQRGINYFCEQYQLPPDNYLLYGMSRGAQWAHRLALRAPQYFLAVNPHVSGSYDRPGPEARRCLWLITGGEVDVGYDNAIAFYQQCRAAGYAVLFKAGADLGHETRADIEALRDAFFEYALAVKDEFKAKSEKEKSAFFKGQAQFIGDFESQRVVPVDRIGKVPEEFRVYLPTEELADAWKLPPPEE